MNKEITRYDHGETSMWPCKDGDFVAWDDYAALRELFEKYISHVGHHEGVDFIDGYGPSSRFSADEWAELERLSESSRRFD